MLLTNKHTIPLCFLCLLLCLNTVNAQKTPKVIKENRERALMDYQEGHFELFRLEERVGEKKWSYFAPVEKEWLYLLHEKWDSLFLKIRHNETFLSAVDLKRAAYFQDIPDEYKRIEPPVEDLFYKKLVEELKTNKEKLSDAIQKASLDKEDKMFLLYYIDYTLHQIAICDEHIQVEAVKKADHYRKEFPEGKWTNFVNKYSPFLKAWNENGVEYLLIVNNNRTMDELGEHLRNGLSVGFQIGYTRNRLYLSGELSGGRTRVTKPFFHHITMEEYRRMSHISTNLSIGYHALLEEKWTVTPFVGTQLNLLRGMPFPYESGDAVNLRPIFGIGPAVGLNVDFNSPKSSCPIKGRSFLYQRQKGRVFRLKVALSYPSLNRVVDELNGGLLQIGIAYGVYQPTIKSIETVE